MTSSHRQSGSTPGSFSGISDLVKISGYFYNDKAKEGEDPWTEGRNLASQQVTQSVKDLEATPRAGPEVFFISPLNDADVEPYRNHLYSDTIQPGARQGSFNKLQDMKKEISSAFGVPDFFWTHQPGSDANGFFNHNHPPKSRFEGSIYGTMSRFLVKKMDQDINNQINGHQKYHHVWNYMGFVTLWYSKAGDGSDATQILLCFDLPEQLREAIRNAFRGSDLESWRHCRFGLYSVIVPIIAHAYDEALWGFRDPIRGIETSRENHEEKMRDRYMSMHELSRHVIHKVETLEVAARTVATIMTHHEKFKDEGCIGEAGAISPGFDFYYRFLENIGFRAQAFDKRLQNEINLASNLSGAEDQEAGRELNLIVSAATLIFLPGSFISGLFGMNFFSYDYDGIQTSKRIYIYFVTTIIATVICILIWAQREAIAKSRKAFKRQ